MSFQTKFRTLNSNLNNPSKKNIKPDWLAVHEIDANHVQWTKDLFGDTSNQFGVFWSLMSIQIAFIPKTIILWRCLNSRNCSCKAQKRPQFQNTDEKMMRKESSVSFQPWGTSISIDSDSSECSTVKRPFSHRWKSFSISFDGCYWFRMKLDTNIRIGVRSMAKALVNLFSFFFCFIDERKEKAETNVY